MLNKNEMIEMLKKDVVPALGCTEPVCVALAAAEASKAVGGTVKAIKLQVNPNIYKNGMSVGIPGFDRVGLDYAVTLGALLKNPQKKLQLLQDLTPEITKQTKTLVEGKCVQVDIKQDERQIFVHAEVTTDLGTGVALIKGSHTNVVLIQANGKELLKADAAASQSGNPLADKLMTMKISQIVDLAESATFEELAFLLDGIEMNEGVAQESLKNPSGVGISKTLQKNMNTAYLKDDLLSRIMLKVASSIDGRLDGCPYTIMSSSGAGSKGLAVILPISETAKAVNASKEKTVRALALGHLINTYINSYIGKLSAMCACSLASATAASAAMTYLLGGNAKQMGFAIRNMTGTITGMICDGGKVGCAMKLATTLSAGVISALLAADNAALRVSDGICAETAEDCIKNIGRVANPGMLATDREILNIMLEKDKK